MDANKYQGLKSSDVKALHNKYGYNRLPVPPLPSVLILFLRQFLSPFIYILLIAAVVSYLVSQLPSAVFILAVLILNSVIGTIQEHSAQKSAAALRNMVRGTAHVVRDGNAQRIDTEDVLPGDLVLLASGDKVPADIKLLSSQDLAIDESMLTGESLAVNKDAHAKVADDAGIAERRNCCFAGSIISRGRAKGIVIAIGLNTEIGKIASHVTKDRTSEPPLIIRVRYFTYQVATAIIMSIVVLVVIMWLRGGYEVNRMLLMTIGLAVSAIPEGLPAALTVALAIGMQRMAKNHVIIRRLVAVEALGSCTYICSDKTGTLTVNELTIRQVVTPDNKVYQVSGEGVKPGGEVTGSSDPKLLDDLCITGILANEGFLNCSEKEWTSDGDIVDVAFLVLAKKLGFTSKDIRDKLEEKELVPYESELALCASLNKHGSKQHILHVKGSPEKMMELCTHMWTEKGPVPIDKGKIQEQFESLAKQGYRIIALAQKDAKSSGAKEQLHSMVFLGMVAMIDPLRPEAAEAVRRCRHGNIGVAMVTGDHPATAKAIAVELNLCSPDDEVVTGKMLREANKNGTAFADALIRKTSVFARIEPSQKEQIVESIRNFGHFVAVTGDGVNDAPAMRSANVGIAMGKGGTDVARETGDLIITDDNFASIVAGIEQGRIVYNNIRKVIALLIATGFSAILLFFLTVAAGLPMPMIAVQLLWLNLVANGLQDVALAFEPKEGGELDASPRKPDEPIFERHIIEHVLVTGTVMGVLAFSNFWYMNSVGYTPVDARNLTLMLMVLFGNIHALSSRSETRSLFQIRFFANPFLVLAVPFAQCFHIAMMYTPYIGDVLELRPITFAQWLWLLAIASILFVVEEVHKIFLRRAHHRKLEQEKDRLGKLPH